MPQGSYATATSEMTHHIPQMTSVINGLFYIFDILNNVIFTQQCYMSIL